jgi:hypothetical protein
MSITLGNYRDWLPFAFIAAGIALALLTPFLPHNKERRQKTMKLIETFRASLHSHDMEHWKEVYAGTRESALAPAGYFMNRLGKPERLDSMWTTGDDDHTAIQRMAECMEKACAEMLSNKLDVKLMWTEIGQLMEGMYAWLQAIPGVQKDLTFLDEAYPSIKQTFQKYGHRFQKWPYRLYAKQ